MRLTDLIETFKGHDKVIFKLTGIGEIEYSTVEFKDAIDTIEALQQENEQLKADIRGKDNEINDLKAIIEYLRKFKPKKNEAVREENV